MSERPSNPNKFFSKEEKQRIVEAIREAEKETSGEIRLHLEKKAGKDIFQRALEVFFKIGMDKTAQRNGVLIYFATGERKFAIIGDEGINRVVPENFWQDVVDLMTEHFRQGKFCEGVCQAIHLIGQKLKTYFPYQSDDVNELSDEISIESEEKRDKE
jgi:uncharacterized membrane protein